MKQPFKKIFLLLVFTHFIIPALNSATLADLQADLNTSLNPTPDLVKTLQDAVDVKNAYLAKPQIFAVYEEQLDEIFYHAADTTFYDLYEAVQKGTTAQQAIINAQTQQAKKGDDSAALKACNTDLTTCKTTLTNYATKGETLHQAAGNFGKSISDPNKLYRDDSGAIKAIPEYVKAFIKYAETTNVSFSDKDNSTMWLGKKWLDHYFDNGCIIESLTNFYIDTLSVLISNDNLKSWNFKADLSPTTKSIDDNKTSLKTKLTNLKTDVTCPENDCSKCPTDYSGIKSGFMQADPCIITFANNTDNKIPDRKAVKYLTDPQYYASYIDQMITLINNVTNKLFVNDATYGTTTITKQAWFDKHPIGDNTFTTNVASAGGSVLTLFNAVDAQLDTLIAAQNNNAPATVISSTVDKTSLTTIETALKTLVAFLGNPDGDLYKKATTGTKDTSTYNTVQDCASTLKDVLSTLNNVLQASDQLTINITIPNPM